MSKTKTTSMTSRAPADNGRDGCLPGGVHRGAKGDAAFIAKALGDIARAKGMTQVARDTGLSARASTRLVG